jgi:hypothetical protein
VNEEVKIEEKKIPLTAEEVEAVRLAGENLGIAYWKEILSMTGMPIRNHAITREAVRKAIEQMKAVVEKWG